MKSCTISFSNPNFPLLFLFFVICLFPFSALSQTVNPQFSPISSSSSVLRLPSDEVNGKTDIESLPVCPVDPDRHSSCPIKCFRTDPVCGEDGITYWCGCAEAHCAGTKVAKLGFCEVGSGGSGLLSGQALLLVHIIWMIALGFAVLCGIL